MGETLVQPEARAGRRPRSPREAILAGLLVVTVGFAVWRHPEFLSALNLTQLATDRIHIGLLSVGMTLVILIAGIDLSVGSTVALSAVVFGLAWERWHAGLWGSLLAAVATGTAAGAVNGLFTAGARVPALIVTLATLSVYRGLAEGTGGGSSIGGFDPRFVELGQRAPLGLPLPTWLLLVLFAASGIYLSRTAGGRAIYAMGANEAAARLAGVPARRIRFRIYTFSGVLAGLAALTYACLNNTVKADVGRGYELDAITVVVLGGTSVAGGEGTMLGSALALALLAAGLNLMDLEGIQRERQSVVVAAVLLISLWLDSWLRKRRGGG
jgi:ribose/xylose/arabinose/galactoside ABC-type transport system permease subunit